jgi:hypothetical protein
MCENCDLSCSNCTGPSNENCIECDENNYF